MVHMKKIIIFFIDNIIKPYFINNNIFILICLFVTFVAYFTTNDIMKMILFFCVLCFLLYILIEKGEVQKK